MNNHRTPLFSAAALPLLLALALPGESIRYGPGEGQSLTRSWTTTTQFSLDDMEMSMNGQPMPMEIEMEMDMDMEMTVEVTDELVSMMEGRPRELHRSYDVLGSTGSFAVEMEMMPGGGDEKTIEAESELEGKSVIFTWNEEDGEYEVAYDEGGGDEELLEGLAEDMDLRALLPAGEVEVDDSWEIDVKLLTAILAPGGDLALVPQLDEEMDMMPGMQDMGRGMHDMLGDMLEGEATGTFKGFEEVDGVRVAVIAIEIAIKSSNDMTEKVMEAMDDMPEEMGQFSVEFMDVEVEIEGEGTLQWDVEAGHAHSFELSGSMGFITDMGMTVTMGDSPVEIEQTMDMSGSFENSMTVSKN